jgi:hypothetical protein
MIVPAVLLFPRGGLEVRYRNVAPGPRFRKTFDPQKYKTFVVNQDGVIYEKDLGPSTSALAEAMTAFDPDKTWRRVR